MDAKIREQIDAARRQMAESFERQVMGAFTESSGKDLAGPDVMAEMERICAHLSQPVAVAVWFIDRPNEYFRVKAACIVEEAKHVARPGYLGHSGLPLYRWTLAEIEARVEELEGKGCAPAMVAEWFPFRLPGVWVEMRNAPHVRIEEPRGSGAVDEVTRGLVRTLEG